MPSANRDRIDRAVDFPINLDEEVALERIRAHAGKVEVDLPGAVEVDALRLPVIEETVLVAVEKFACHNHLVGARIDRGVEDHAMIA